MILITQLFEGCLGLALQVIEFLSLKVQSAIHHVRRSLPMDGNEAMAVVSLLECAENLQINLKAVLKEDADWYRRFMPLTEVVNTNMKI